MLRILAILSGMFLVLFGYALFPARRLPQHVLCDRLLVYKKKRQLHVWAGGERMKIYRIALGKQPLGAKTVEGDRRTPEGKYWIDSKNPKSAFYLNLGISYPSAEDKIYAEKLGKPAGGDIKIHGLRNGSGWKGRLHRISNWTAGCIAVTNAEMEELYAAVPIGTPIIIYP